MVLSYTRTLSISLAFLLFGICSDSTWAQINPKIDPVLSKDLNVSKACFIVFESVDLSDAYSLKGKENKGRFVFDALMAHSQSSQRSVVKYLSSIGIDHQAFFVVNAIFTHLSLEQIAYIAQFDEVQTIIANGSLEQEHVENELALRSPEFTWGLSMIGADKVWDLGFRGQGVIIGGEDTGVKWDIPSIEKSYRGNQGGTPDHNYNWHDAIHEINPMHGDSIIAPENNPCGLDSKVPCDDHNHGTHTIGTMTGEDGDIKIGVAPDAQWIACRCMERGYGTLQTYVECFEWFLAPTDLNGNNPEPTKAPDVINNSWHCPAIEGCNPTNFDIMEQAVNNLKAAGIMVVVSAGNDGPNCSTIKSPAPIFENSFTVGATNRRDTITGFSSRGPVVIDSTFRIKPNVSAPGQGVKSQLPDSSYANWNGTSMAAPHVSGLVALILSANPDLRGEVDMIEDIIESTAIPKTLFGEGCDADSTAVPNNIYGHGRINALAAVEKALSLISTSNQQPEAQDIHFVSPFGASLQVSWKQEHGITDVELLNISGRSIRRQAVSGHLQIDWDTRYLQSGVYILKMYAPSSERTIKLVKH